MRFPRQCPKCGSQKVLRIVYGLLDPFAFKDNMYPGGCVVFDDDPDWHCDSCDWEWGPKSEGKYNKDEGLLDE